MSATLTIKKVHTRRLTGQRLVTGTIDFDASYPTGGEVISLPLSEVEGIGIENKSGYLFLFDYENNKVKVLTPVAAQVAHTHAVALDTGASATGASHNHAFTGTSAGLSIVTGEALTVTTDVGTLANLPAVILAIHGTVGATSTNFKVVAAARTLATGEVHVNYTTGELTFYATDDPTDVTVDYLKKAAIPTGSNAAEAAHTHGPGTLADAASAAGGAITAAAAAEVASATDLSALTSVAFVAWGW